MWKNGSTATNVVVLVASSTAPSVCAMFATRLRWVSITPFDRPVVPDEYGSTTTSSRSTGTCSASGATHQVGERAGALGLADDEHLLDGRALGGRSGDLEERRDRDEQPGVRVDELVVDLALDVRRVDRGDHPAG